VRSPPQLTATQADARTIETLFPLIEELGVDAYWVDNECRYFHYPRGSFSNDTTPNGGCRVWDFPDPEPFDPQANHDIDRLINAIRDTHARISYMSIVRNGGSSDIGPNRTFGIGPCDNLIYNPAWLTFQVRPSRSTCRAARSPAR